MKIVDALDLIGIESANLFGVETNLASLLKIPNELLNSKNLDEILSKAVNNIIFELNLLSAFITLKKGNKLFAQITTDRWFIKPVLEVIGKPFTELNVDLSQDTNNFCVKAFLDRKPYYTENLDDVTVPAVSKTVSKMLQKLTGFKSGIVFPIIHEDECLGIFFVGKNFIDDHKAEIPVIEEFTKYIGEAISKQ